MTLREPVTRVRNATHPEEFTIYDDGVVLDITGASLTLTVNTAEDGSGTDLFASTGSITDAANGVVEFPVSAANADQAAATYYYDVQMTLSGEVTYPSRGAWTVLPNIT